MHQWQIVLMVASSFLKLFFIDYLEISHHTPRSCLLLSLPMSILLPYGSTCSTQKKKQVICVVHIFTGAWANSYWLTSQGRMSPFLPVSASETTSWGTPYSSWSRAELALQCPSLHLHSNAVGQWASRPVLPWPWTLTWLQVAAPTTDVKDFGVTQAADINTALGHIRTLTHSWPSGPTWTTSLNMVSHQHCSLRRQQLRTSPRHQAASEAAYIHMDLRLQRSLGQQRGPLTPTWPPVGFQIMVVFWEGPIQKVNLFPSRTEPGGIPKLGIRFGDWVCSCRSSRLLYTNHSYNPTGQWKHGDLSPVFHLSPPSYLQLHLSIVLTLHHSIFLSFLPLLEMGIYSSPCSIGCTWNKITLVWLSIPEKNATMPH